MLFVAVLKWTSLSRSPVLTIRCHYQGVRAGGSQAWCMGVWGSQVWCPGGLGHLYSEAKALWVMVTWGTPEQTDKSENITFPQVHWRSVTTWLLVSTHISNQNFDLKSISKIIKILQWSMWLTTHRLPIIWKSCWFSLFDNSWEGWFDALGLRWPVCDIVLFKVSSLKQYWSFYIFFGCTWKRYPAQAVP